MPGPRLLISVRNAAEAAEALAAGADLIDVKEPRRGALGMADVATIHSVLEVVGSRLPTSVALGELLAGNVLSQLEPFPTYAKFGLAGAARTDDWVGKLRSAIGLLPRGVQAVAVAYADWQAAAAPHPREVLDAAGELGCRGILFDTCNKAGGSLTAHVSVADLGELVTSSRRAGLRTVLAGSLQVRDLAALAPVAADYFGFRGAVCGGGRESALDPHQLRNLREVVWQLAPASPGSAAPSHAAQPGQFA